MNSFIHTYFAPGSMSLTRALRLFGGLGFAVFGICRGDGLTTILGTLLFVQGIFNVGCMGGACALPPEDKSTLAEKEALHD